MKKFILAFISFFICFLGYSQKRYALIIGNSNYQTISPLKNPINDAKLLATKLSECGFGVDMQIDVSRKQIISALNEFYNKIKAEPCIALFYYSGHGVQFEGENYVIPVNAVIQSKSDIESECVPLGRVMGKMDESQSTANIIILDACRNDPFMKAWYRGDGEKGLTIPKRAPKESFIAFATAPGEVANDGNGNNSPFSQVLAKYITQPGITIEQVFKKVNTDVKKIYPSQIPWTNSSLGIDFYFKLASVKSNEPEKKADVINARFMSSANCILYLNGDSLGKVNAGAYLSKKLKPGLYKVKAVSIDNPNVFIEEEHDYQLNQYENNEVVQLLPLLNKINESKDAQYEKQIRDLQVNRTASTSSEAKELDQKAIVEQIKNNMVFVEGGEFDMGTVSGNNDETPVHRIEITSFYLNKYEVTQAQWLSIMGNNPSKGNPNCKDCPVDNISWNDVQKFIEKLNALTGRNYRLPTEAEWEYASRGGKLKATERYSGSSRIDKYGWYYENAAGKSHFVGQLGKNELGIFDMSGNVAEWCSDWYDASYYSYSEPRNPLGPKDGKYKVVRGGSWDDYDKNCRINARDKHKTEAKANSLGFRLALSIIKE